jgi:hypothetical protein
MHRIPTSLAPFIAGETDDFSAVFSLIGAETIASATAVCSVVWGTDASAASRAASPTTSGDTVTSRVTGPLAGNIYRLRFTATLSSGRILKNDIWFEVRA